MSIAKPFTFVANTYAKASEVNANFDTVYSQVNSNISAISQNAVDIENLENNKADINGSSSQRFGVADAITDGDAINKRSLRAAIGNSIDYISGFIITKDSGSPEDTIIVSEGSCYDSTKTVVLNKTNSSTKTNDNQAANATYYVYVIGNATGSQVDVLISELGVTPGLPSGYSLYRQIGYYTTDSNNIINDVSYYGIAQNSDKNISSIIYSVMPDYSKGVNRSPNTNYLASTNICLYVKTLTDSRSGSISVTPPNGTTTSIADFAGNVFTTTSRHFYLPKGTEYNCSGNCYETLVEFPLIGGV